MDEMMMKLDVRTVTGVPMRVIYLPAGMPSMHYPAEYDPNNATTARIEWYDKRFAHTTDGQFTGGRYYLKDMLAMADGVGLMLQTDVDAWGIDGPTMDLVKTWLRNVARVGKD